MQSTAVFLVLTLVGGISCRNIKFERAVLDEHNKHRASHNAGNLKLDAELSKNATTSAKQAAKSESFDNISPGQSVFLSCATFNRQVSGKEITDAWYGEVCNPDFDFNEPDNEKARGFTQLVWKDTSRLGIGKATGRGKNGDICVYIVGVYRPPGNLVGFFEENVDKGTFDKEKYCKDGEEEDSDNDDSGGQKNEEVESRDKEDNADKIKEEEEEKEEEDLKVQVAMKDKTEKVSIKDSKQNNKGITSKMKG